MLKCPYGHKAEVESEGPPCQHCLECWRVGNGVRTYWCDGAPQTEMEHEPHRQRTQDPIYMEVAQ